MIASLGYSLVALALFVVTLQVYTRRGFRRPPPVPHVLAIWLLGAVAVIVVIAVTRPEHRTALAVMNLSLYLFAGEVYVFTYAATVGSVSIKLMVRMLELEPRPDAFRLAIAEYSPVVFLDVRLHSLVEQGLLRTDGNRYHVTARGRRWAMAGLLLKRWLAVGPGG